LISQGATVIEKNATNPLFFAQLAAAFVVLLGSSCWAQNTPAVVAEPVEFVTSRLSKEQLHALRQGGFVLYMRHGTTDSSQPDQPGLDINNCSTQRPLNDEGRKVARQVGAAIKKLRIPVGEVRTSPLCRTRETAQLAFGPGATVDPLLIYTSHLTSEQKQPVIENTRKRLSEPVPTGSNRVLVAHGPNLADVMGYFVKPEGTVVVLQPRGHNKFDYLATVTPDQWADLR
jgi:phosphohistidine phosphatase SixA